MMGCKSMWSCGIFFLYIHGVKEVNATTRQPRNLQCTTATPGQRRDSVIFVQQTTFAKAYAVMQFPDRSIK